MRASLPVFAVLLAISSCSSPPKAPTVDESRKRPANTAAAIDMQACQSDLQNSRILVKEATRLAETASAAAARLAMSEQASAKRSADGSEMANTVYTLHFDFGSARVSIPDEDVRGLVERARAAPLVMLRARTDGQIESLAESRIARQRAVAVRAYLVQSGVAPERIRMTWQPVGDTVNDNGTPSARAQNRRVEIELYRSAPRRLATGREAPLA